MAQVKRRYGFDLDGTVSLPAIRDLANDLYDAGHDVYIITGGLADSGEWTMQARIDRLQEYGVRYTEIVRVLDPDISKLGRLKGDECNRLGVSVMLDDAVPYLVGIGEVSHVQRLLVIP